MIKERLRRIQDLYGTYQINEQTLRVANSQGKMASLRRQQVFLKEKILCSLRLIQLDMQPKLFVVCLVSVSNPIEKITIIVRADTPEDVKTYIELLRLTHQENYIIQSIAPLETIYKGHINLTVEK